MQPVESTYETMHSASSEASSDELTSDDEDDSLENRFVELLLKENATKERVNLVHLMSKNKLIVNFAGSTVRELQKNLWLHMHGQRAIRFFHPSAVIVAAANEYDMMLQKLTLEKLASMLSAEQRRHYLEKGWLKIDLQLTPLELH